jgi:hypothetical protein
MLAVCSELAGVGLAIRAITAVGAAHDLHALGRLYDQLTPRERLPLLMAAHRRGDAAEYHRLDRSAPKQVFRVANYYPLTKALDAASNLHLQCVLDLAGAFWQCWGLWMAAAESSAPEETRQERCRQEVTAGAPMCPCVGVHGLDGSRAWGLMRYYASRFMAHTGGWQQFCADLHIDPEALVEFRIGWGLVAQTAKVARGLVFSAEEPAEFLRRESSAAAGDAAPEHGLAPVECVADLVRSWHAMLDDLVVPEAVR